MPYVGSVSASTDLGNNNNFQPSGGAGSQQEFSTVYDRPIPEQMWVMQRHVNYVGFSAWMRFMGNAVGCSNPTVGHYEEPWKDDLFAVGSIITPAGGAGNNMVVETTAGSMYDSGQTLAAASQQTSFPLVNDTIEFFDGEKAQIIAKDVSVTPHRFTLKPLLSTVDLDSSVSAGQSYHITEPLFAEGSGLPEMRALRFLKYQNTFGITKTVWKSTGSELTNNIYPEAPGGGQGPVHLRIRPNFLYYHERGRDRLMLFGQQANNLTQANTSISIDVSIAGAEGFVPFAKSAGTIDNWTPGSYTLADLDAVSTILEDNRSVQPGELVCSWQGTDYHGDLENAIVSLLTPELTTFALNKMIPGYSGFDFDAIADTDGSYDNALSVGIMAIRKKGINFSFKKMPAFNDTRGAGATGYAYKNTAIFHPMSFVDRKGASHAAVGYEYKQAGGYSRDLVPSILPGAGTNTFANTTVAVNENDVFTESLLSEIAPHFGKGNCIVYQEP